MGIRVTPIDNKPRLFEWYGLRVWAQYQNSHHKLMAKRLELVSEMGLTEEEFGQMLEHERNRIFGRAFIGTVVIDIEDAEIVENAGEENESVIEFKFNAPSTMPEYETMGEELLGEDDGLRDALLSFSVNAEHYREKREARALGNSKAPSDSGGK